MWKALIVGAVIGAAAGYLMAGATGGQIETTLRSMGVSK